MGRLEHEIRHHLREGERLLWFGRPSKPLASSSRFLNEIAWAVAVILGLLMANSFLSDYPVAQLVIVAVGALTVFSLLLHILAAFMSNRKFMRQTAYAITRERAIVLVGAQVFSQNLAPTTHFQHSTTTPQTVLIWDNAVQVRAEEPPMRFQQLADGEAAAVLQDLIGGEHSSKS